MTARTRLRATRPRVDEFDPVAWGASLDDVASIHAAARAWARATSAASAPGRRAWAAAWPFVRGHVHRDVCARLASSTDQETPS